MQKKRIFHVISNTHWDREWRYPFQKNRQMLVEMIDKSLEILDTEPEFKYFHLDSQSVVLEDYLEIKPHKRPLIEKFVKEGRLLIGPWYILPEEFQVGGESLIRNLLVGHRICNKIGKVMKVGYSPFSWGQISQLPQIYKEFGIDVILFYRGVNSLDSEKAEFIWQGADGTKAVTSRFSTLPRYNFYFYIYRPVIHNEQMTDVEYKWQKGGLPFHFADKELIDEDYSNLKPLNQYHEKNLKPSVEEIIRDQANDFTTQHIMWADGHDSSGPNKAIVKIIKDANQLLAEDEVIHSNLEIYADSLKNAVNYKTLKLVKGERRSSQYDRRSGNMYGYTTSARMYLKQINFDVERWLQFYAEPFNSIANILGCDTKDNYLEVAWKMLLQNSAHDSIGGCSLDMVHEDMITRYKQLKEIAIGVFDRACKYLIKQIDLSKEKEEIFLTVINPMPYSRDDIVEAYIDIPQDLNKGCFRVKDFLNNPVDLQIIDSYKSEPVLEQMIDRPMYFSMQRYHCFINLKDIPALGYKSYKIEAVRDQKSEEKNKIGRIENNAVVLENDFLKVEFNPNGTFNIIDKQSDYCFKNQGYFYDEGEAGHAWVHEAIAPVFDTLNSTPHIKLFENGSLFAKCRIQYTMRLPFSLQQRQVNKQDVEIPVEFDVILKKNQRRVEFEIKLVNNAENHRLRLMFPLGLNATASFGEGQFDVVERKIKREDTSDWIEQPMYDYPMHQFVALANKQQGAAILVDGLKEYEVLDNGKNTLAITLLRAFNYVIQPSSVQDYSDQKGSQCLGEQTYRMAFYPFSGDWEQGGVYKESLHFNNSLRLIQSGKSKGELSQKVSFLEIQPENLIYSCLKFPEDGLDNTWVVRLYNPTCNEISGKIILFKNARKVTKISLEELMIETVQLKKDNTIDIRVLPKKIITLKILF
jgi:alpha-mannosidase